MYYNPKKCNSREEAVNTPECRFYLSLGYTEAQSILLTMISLNDPFGGYTLIIQAYENKKASDQRSFSEFFCDYVFNTERLLDDGLIPKPEQPVPQSQSPEKSAGNAKPSGSFINRLLSNIGISRTHGGNDGSSGCVVNDSISAAHAFQRPAKGRSAPMPSSAPESSSAPKSVFASSMPASSPRPVSASQNIPTFRKAASAPRTGYDSVDFSYAPADADGASSEYAESTFSDSFEENVDFSAGPDSDAISAPLPEIDEDIIENIRTDSYETIEEKGMKDTAASPTSTFRTTYNTAAASVLLSNIREGSYTRHSMVRTEELLNYLSYRLDQPEDEMFAVTKELKQIDQKEYLFLGIQGRRTLPSRQNICFLLDVSGSMRSRSDQMLMSMMAVLSRMNDGDIFSLVTYSSNDKVVINGLKLNKAGDIDDILRIIMKEVVIYGCTYGSAGINKAYEIIEANMILNGVNRVIILTDGDLNFGISDKDGLKGLIEKKKKTGAYFSAIGTGIFNLQDDKLEALAKNGNGNYFVVNSQSDIEKNIVENYESLVYPIAKNVKAQVEFNPAKVAKYRLIGYENRALSHEDFRDDTVIAEPFGSGSYCIALYELVMNTGKTASSGLKYQTAALSDSDELATLSLRYEDIDSGTFHEMAFPINDSLPATDNIERAVECAALARKMRGSLVDAMTKDRLLRLLEKKNTDSCADV